MERAGKHGDHTTQHDEGTAFRPGDYFSGLLEGATPDLKSKYAFYPWRIEILINELFSEGEGQIKDLERKRVNLSSFNGISLVSNKLYEAECADDAASIDGDMHILNQMHRIIHLQTEWQSGFLKYSNFYRAGFLYGGVLSRGTFKTRSGVDLELFTKAIFYLYAIYQNNSGIRLDNERGIVDIDPNDLNTIDLPPVGPSIITRVCRFEIGIRGVVSWQARRARSHQGAQASGALRAASGCRARSAA